MKALKLLLAISLVTNVVLCGVLWRGTNRPALVENSSLKDETSRIDASGFGNPITAHDLPAYLGRPIKLVDETFNEKRLLRFNLDTSPMEIEDGPLKLPFREQPRSEQGLFVSPEGV